ncbi:hypothetical protein H2198_001506 [Neophaeococcomyces mojaviensis]|uniref:Uncharacterized protein n=1 Tax=Neophaeococcomyces mojaviensis TaxID=3383035 RepID=A0ACC3AGM1_9EURO|nr:hypothetical protein H2198_001506 [Knufia sp. JES_112]
MARPTNTTTQTVFERTDPSSATNNAIFELQSDPARPGLTRITLPANSTWTPGPHWHERHTEFFKVIRGKVIIKLDGLVKVIGPEDGTQRVDRFVVHEFMRADRNQPEDKKDAGDVITEEWTDPADGSKHVFFRNIFSTLQDSDRYWKSWTSLQIIVTCAEYDNFDVILPGMFQYAMTYTLFSTVRVLGRVLRLRPWYEEYTPEGLRSAAVGGQNSKQD